MKVIDILNKIANGEEVRFKINGNILYLSKGDSLYNMTLGEDICWFIDERWLNKEVEIIEEDKKIERLNYIHPGISCSYNESEILLRVEANKDKINEIIDYINKEKDND